MEIVPGEVQWGAPPSGELYTSEVAEYSDLYLTLYLGNGARYEVIIIINNNNHDNVYGAVIMK